MFGQKRFSFNDIPDLTDKVAIVTGGNAGIGYVTARELARKNAHVIVCSRSIERGQTAVNKIKTETNNDKVEVLQLDLADWKGTKDAADSFVARKLPVNNAGIMATPYELNEHGIEKQFATNHVGHFVFTKVLLPVIEASAPSRIVNITSDYHRLGINFDDINLEKESVWARYGQSKTANILFTIELARRLEGKQVWANAVHPGFVATNLTQGYMAQSGVLVKTIVNLVKTIFALNEDDGALTQLYAATSPEIEKENYRGKYFVPIAKLETPRPFATNQETVSRLWKWTEELLNEKLGI
ncbi:6241_t:CDS:2 [Ambispora gerdemannii]|uniref:6241_t:CDS:1 n=1 Tax=Ambispora gerdemannii TaxID=144530 RepID=A0A9N9AKR8_9GLOM|nr:6241_t:CDS:2 [Ambispora gerdemannii]